MEAYVDLFSGSRVPETCHDRPEITGEDIIRDNDGPRLAQMVVR